MRHYWLEKAGIHEYPDNSWGERSFFRRIKMSWRAWRTKRRTGVDPRDCYCMDTAFYQWLYEHLCQLQNDTKADLLYYTFVHNGKEYFEGDYIEYLKGLLIKALEFDEMNGIPLIPEDREIPDRDILMEKFNKAVMKNLADYKIIKEEILQVFSDLLPSLWW